MKPFWKRFTRLELLLWSCSVLAVTVTFCLFDRSNPLTLAASLVGITSLIFAAKGNPVSLVLMIVFSLLYGVISYSFAYYGEMLTYLAMTLPMSVYSLAEWLRHPFRENRAEVQIGRVGKKGVAVISLLTVAVTVVFYFLLREFGTANLLPSTFSVATSFFAVCLTARRSPYFALAYALNDAVLILLWVLAATKDTSYVAVITCFAAFLVHDLYTFFSWLRMEKKQSETA